MACAMLGLFASAHAADNGVYAGFSVGESKANVDSFFGGSVDEKDTGFKIFTGLRPLDWLGVEISYVNLGQVSADTPFIGGSSRSHVKTSGVDAVGLLFWDVGMFDVFAKGGLIRWDASGTVDGFFGRFPVNDSGTDLVWGAGAQVRFGSLAARLEYERFDIDASEGFAGKPQMISLGLTYTFF
jgi:hypothetical protein